LYPGSSIKQYRSNTYQPLLDTDEQGAFFADHGAESDYQGASRGREPGVDSSVSNVLVADIIIVILTIRASPDIGASLRLGKH
jgi:hypothetical protein